MLKTASLFLKNALVDSVKRAFHNVFHNLLKVLWKAKQRLFSSCSGNLHQRFYTIPAKPNSTVYTPAFFCSCDNDDFSTNASTNFSFLLHTLSTFQNETDKFHFFTFSQNEQCGENNKQFRTSFLFSTVSTTSTTTTIFLFLSFLSFLHLRCHSQKNLWKPFCQTIIPLWNVPYNCYPN